MHNQKELQATDWEPYWSGSWPIISFSSWGLLYCRHSLAQDLPSFVKNVVIAWEDDKSTCYLHRSDRERFAQKIISLVKRKAISIPEICMQLKQATSTYLSFVQRKRKDVTLQEYRQHQEVLVEKYYPSHIIIKVSVDFLPKEMLDRYLPLMEEARKYAEPVFSQNVKFMDSMSNNVAQKSKYPSALIRALLHQEFVDYLTTGQLPVSTVLQKRNEKSLFLFTEGRPPQIFVGNKATWGPLSTNSASEIRGVGAFPGKAQGTVRIILDPRKKAVFNGGDVLVTAMTRPEYLPLIQKAGAIVTDAGGILCHAAITARELKKPCIIGTRNATKILKDGDMVEVDAEKGVVKVFL